MIIVLLSLLDNNKTLSSSARWNKDNDDGGYQDITAFLTIHWGLWIRVELLKKGARPSFASSIMAVAAPPLSEMEEGRNISQLQYVLKLAHSPAVADQQKVRLSIFPPNDDGVK